MKSGLICISGPDGVGKTTQVNLIIKELTDKGIKCTHKWIRFPFLLSMPLLIAARLSGRTEMTTLESGRRIGYHHFHDSNIISRIYPILLYLDTKIHLILRVKLSNLVAKKIIVCDRFVYDILVDLMISIGERDLNRKNIGHRFTMLIPPNTKTVILLGNEETLRSRRDDVEMDKTLLEKIFLYRKIAEDQGLPIIDASLPINVIHGMIADIIKMELSE